MQPSIKIQSDDKTLKPGLENIEPLERHKTDQFSMDDPFFISSDMLLPACWTVKNLESNQDSAGHHQPSFFLWSRRPRPQTSSVTARGLSNHALKKRVETWIETYCSTGLHAVEIRWNVL